VAEKQAKVSMQVQYTGDSQQTHNLHTHAHVPAQTHTLT